MDKKIFAIVASIVTPLVLALVGATWVVASSIGASEARVTARLSAGIAALKDDVAEIKHDTEYLKGRLKPLAAAGQEE